MTRTVVTVAFALAAMMTLARPASADLLDGVPTTTIWDDYYEILPQLQALQAWGHAHGMPYAVPGSWDPTAQLSDWQSRQASQDRMNEAWSDYMLGYQDVYNPNTGEVVEAQSGFNNYYSTDSSTLWQTDSYFTPGGATIWEPVDGLSANAWPE